MPVSPLRLKITVNGAEVDYQKRSLILSSELGQRISTARFTIVGEPRRDTASLAAAPVSAIGGYTRPRELDEIRISRRDNPLVNCATLPVVALGGVSTYLDDFFGGYIVKIEKDKLGVGNMRSLYHCQAQDYNVRPTQVLVTESYVAQTEQQIIDDLFTTYLPIIETSTYVESSGATITIDWTRRRLGEALEELAGINEKQWYIDFDLFLHYFTPVTTSAPFILSDAPALTTRIPYDDIHHVEDATGIINRVTVVGDGVVRTRTDAASFALYGRYFDGKVVDNNIDTNAWADAVGDAVLADLAFAKVAGSLTCYQEGLVIGQKVRVENAFRDVDAFYVIRALKLSKMSLARGRVDVQYGDYKPRLMDLLLQISREERKE